jgi:cytochrome c oxidase subunit 3
MSITTAGREAPHEPSTGLQPSEPWNTVAEESAAANFGMWLFIGTEVLFFGGLFLSYTVARYLYNAGFLEAARHTNIYFGTANTIVLITSSLTMVVAIRGAGLGARRLVWICLAVTAALGAVFLIVKGFEYREDLKEHLFPGRGFALHGMGAALFFSLYWIMTGIHAVHLTVGVILVARFSWLMRSEPLRIPDLPIYGLYWHFVDTIWIFLYPLLYLSGRA